MNKNLIPHPFNIYSPSINNNINKFNHRTSFSHSNNNLNLIKKRKFSPRLIRNSEGNVFINKNKQYFLNINNNNNSNKNKELKNIFKKQNSLNSNILNKNKSNEFNLNKIPNSGRENKSKLKKREASLKNKHFNINEYSISYNNSISNQNNSKNISNNNLINHESKNNSHKLLNLSYYKKNTNLENPSKFSKFFEHKFNNNLNNLTKEEEYFDYSNLNSKEIELTKEEKNIFGERTMKTYHKIKLLGKGGCGIVWLAKKIINDNDDIIFSEEEYALKQTSKKGNIFGTINVENLNIARNEIEILKILNENKCEVIPKIFEYYEDNNDIWFSFEKGGLSLSNLSFKIKGEFLNNERIYNIQKGIFLRYLFENVDEFKFLIKNLLEGIDYINSKGIIHSDLKPENILIEFIKPGFDQKFSITKIKIIDYGSAFHYDNINEITSNTPEYLCPEITIGNKKFLNEINKYINSIDIWSLGITLLELCLCCPVWMNFKAKVILNNKIRFTTGLFGIRGRDSNKIYHKQIELNKNLKSLLKNSYLYNFNEEDRENFEDLLSKMLNIDYKKRISSKEALNHKFLN